MRLKVSSVSGKDVRAYGKQHLVDGSAETCWSSEQGSPQWVLVELEQGARVLRQVQLMFQGGFAGKDVTLTAMRKGDVPGAPGEEVVWEGPLYPQDTNAMQILEVPSLVEVGLPVDRVRLTFASSTDMYGRIVLYHLALLTVEGECAT